MKKIIALLLAVLMLTTVFAGCSQADEAEDTAEEAAVTEETTDETTEDAEASEETTEDAEETAEIPFETVTEGVLTVGTSPDFAPYEFYIVDEDGSMEMVGFDIALAQAIADYYGLELKMQALSFDALLLELQTGTIDLAIAGFSPDPERMETTDFSDVYYYGTQSFVILGENADKYTSYEDFDGLTVEAQTGSIQYALAEENTPNAKITGIKAVTTIISDLREGKCEGAFIETAVAESYIRSYPELAIAWEVEYDAEGSCVAIKKGNQAMLDAVNEVIAQVLADGSMDQFIALANELASSDNAQEISAE